MVKLRVNGGYTDDGIGMALGVKRYLRRKGFNCQSLLKSRTTKIKETLQHHL
jgi:hypothetical protein